MNKIYFDNVSTTSLNDEVLKTYKKLLDEYYCNSDALYDDGVAIYNMQEKARKIIADCFNVAKDEIIFTSGASEANSLAIKGLCFNNKRKHLITSIYEHSSVYNSIRQLEEHFGFEVTYLYPDEKGMIRPLDVKNALRDDTLLVSIMLVNNEIGAINDINAIKEIVKKNSGTYFHCDITQGLAKVPIDLKDVDMASFSAHKIHGLKGSGALIKKKHVELLPLISGGQQEFGLRGGTSNALTNICLAKTLRLAIEKEASYNKHTSELNQYFLSKIKEVKGVTVNSFDTCLPSLINISTPIKSEVELNALNARDIMVSSKSTCGSRKNEGNRTLKALNIDEDYALRISFSEANTKEEIDYFIECLKEDIKRYDYI